MSHVRDILLFVIAHVLTLKGGSTCKLFFNSSNKIHDIIQLFLTAI